MGHCKAVFNAGELVDGAAESRSDSSMGRDHEEGAHPTGAGADQLAARHVLRKTAGESIGVVDLW